MIVNIARIAKKWPWLYYKLRSVYIYLLGLFILMKARIPVWWSRILSMHAAASDQSPRIRQIGSCAVGHEIVMLVVSDLRIDPRVEREARALAGAGYVVTVICPEPSDGAGKSFNINWGPNVHIDYVSWTAAAFVNTRPGYFADILYSEAVKRNPFAFHAHDLNTSYAGLAAAKATGSHLVVDFHEWFSENVHWDGVKSENVPYPPDWKLELQKLEVRCLTEASATVTVCDSIADAMADELGGQRPIVVRNIPNLNAVATKEYPSIKQQFGLPESCFVVLWQGGTGPTRMIEPIIEALVHAPLATLIVRGPSLDLFGDGYRQLAKSLGVEDRLILAQPVTSRDVVAAARGADAGIWTLPALCRNFTYALPNKIFEYIASGLPVLAAHYPEAKRLLADHDLGLTFDPYSPHSIAEAINQLIDDPSLASRFRTNTSRALQQLDAGLEWQKLVTLYDNLPRANIGDAHRVPSKGFSSLVEWVEQKLRHVTRAAIPKTIRDKLLTLRAVCRSPGGPSWKLIAREVIPKTVRSHLLTVRAISQLPSGASLLLRYAIRIFFRSLGLLKFCDLVSRRVLKSAIRRGKLSSDARMANGEVRTIWGVTPILTLALKARADRSLGFKSVSFVYGTYITTSNFDINLRKLYIFASALGILPAVQRMVLAWALMRYDVFHAFADRGFLDPTSRLQINPEELAIWHAAGKRLYIYAYGADVRTREKTLALGRWNFCVDCTEPPKYCLCSDSTGAENMAQIAKYATAVVSLGDMLTYMPGAKHLNYWPIDTDHIAPAKPVRVNGPLRVGHAPNHTHFKGSAYLEQAISKLQSRGHSIEYVKIQGVPNTQVLDLFESCDLIADQFIGGAYGYTALEAMALGRPVLSFVRNRKLLDAPEECPIINATPDTIDEVLTWVLENRARLVAIGEQGKSYVRRWHSIDAVALRLGQLYRETANFPEKISHKIAAQREKEIQRRNSIPILSGWEHPYQVS